MNSTCTGLRFIPDGQEFLHMNLNISLTVSLPVWGLESGTTTLRCTPLFLSPTYMACMLLQRIMWSHMCGGISAKKKKQINIFLLLTCIVNLYWNHQLLEHVAHNAKPTLDCVVTMRMSVWHGRTIFYQLVSIWSQRGMMCLFQ